MRNIKKIEEMKVLLLTAPYGNGHAQVAKSLEEAFYEKGFKNVIVKDFYTESSEFFSKLSQIIYLQSYKPYGKLFYGMFYYGIDLVTNPHKIASPYVSFGYHMLNRLIEKIQPDILINTFPVSSAYVYSKYKHIPLYTVITDYYANNTWLSTVTTKTFVATETVKNAIKEKGIERKKIVVTGIPIRKYFEEPLEREKIYAKYNLKNNLPTLLVVAGAFGVLTDIKGIIHELLEENKYQIIMVCGKNKELYNLLAEKEKKEHNFYLFGYCESEKLNELMAVSDLMLTKAGGIMLSEAVARGIPLILHNPVYGQENENAKFFMNHGAAVITRNSEEILNNSKKLLSDRAKLSYMKKCIKNIHHPKSSLSIVEAIKKDYYTGVI
jgi:processive 1,2-diacylglycerol beta-glucosyltransferase